jgi:hypothetical protein
LKRKYCNLIQIIYENSFETNELYPEVLSYIKEIFSIEEIKNQDELDSTESALDLITSNISYFESDFNKDILNYLNRINNYLTLSVLSLKTKTVRALAEIIAYTDNPDIFEPLIFKILETTLQAFESSNNNENEVIKIFLFNI